MHNEIITKQDLQQFKSDLFNEMKRLMQPGINVNATNWLRSVDVRKMLRISSGTLQSLRETGKLRYTRLGGTLYYDQEDILKHLEENKIQRAKS